MPCPVAHALVEATGTQGVVSAVEYLQRVADVTLGKGPCPEVGLKERSENPGRLRSSYG